MQQTSKTTQLTTQSATRGMTRPVLVSAVFFMLVTGLAYPLAVTGVANILFPDQAQGSQIRENGQPVGSRVIGQYFTKPEYFHGRPSVTSPERDLARRRWVPLKRWGTVRRWAKSG